METKDLSKLDLAFVLDTTSGIKTCIKHAKEV